MSSSPRPVKRDTAQTIYAELSERLKSLGRADARVVVTFPVPVPSNFAEAEVLSLLEKQGYTRLFQRTAAASAPIESKSAKKKSSNKKTAKAAAEEQASVCLEMIQDRFRFDNTERERVIEALESDRY